MSAMQLKIAARIVERRRDMRSRCYKQWPVICLAAVLCWCLGLHNAQNNI